MSNRRGRRIRVGILGALVAGGGCLGSGPRPSEAATLRAFQTVNMYLAAPAAIPADSSIPVYSRAENVLAIEPTPDELQSMLQSSGQADLSAIRGLRAVVFRVSSPITATEILRYYGTSPLPAGRSLGGGMVRTPAVAGPRTGLGISQAGFRPLTTEPGYLIVAVSPYPARPQDLQVTVTRVTGPPALASVLDEVAAVVDRNVAGGRLGGREADLLMFEFPGSKRERDIYLPGADAPKLIQQIAALDLPADVRATFVSLLNSAQSISFTSYLRQGVISPEDFYRFYAKAAERMAWSEVSRDPRNPEAPAILFNVGGHGTAWVRAEVTGVLVPGAPGLQARGRKMTRITLLIIEGAPEAKAAGDRAP